MDEDLATSRWTLPVCLRNCNLLGTTLINYILPTQGRCSNNRTSLYREEIEERPIEKKIIYTPDVT